MKAEPKAGCCRLGSDMPAAWKVCACSSVFDASRTLGVAQTSTTSRAARPTRPALIDHAGATIATADATARQETAISAVPAASRTRPLASQATNQSTAAAGGHIHQRGLPRKIPPVAARAGVPNVASNARAWDPCGTRLMIRTPAPSSAAGTATQAQFLPRGRAWRAGAATVAACAAHSTAYDGTKESVSFRARARPNGPAPRAGSGCPRGSRTSTTNPATL